MKKIILTLILGIIAFSAIFAQTPQGINYQAVARNSTGGLLSNSSISLRISILDKTATGTSVFTETHAVTTNALGLFTFVIGKGTLVSGDFTKIDWSTNDKFLEVEMDSNGGSSYTVMGTSQLVSVPYALYSAKAGNAKTYNAGKGISISNDSIINTSQDQKVNLSSTGGTSITGTYPNFTIGSKIYTAGKGVSISNDTISSPWVIGTKQISYFSVPTDTIIFYDDPKSQMQIRTGSNAAIDFSADADNKNGGHIVYRMGATETNSLGYNRGFTLQDITSNAVRFFVSPVGNIGIGTTAPNSLLSVNLTGDNQQGVNVSSGSNSNINFQPLTGTNLGFQAINFNGYFNSGEKRYYSSKYRWRLGADQRSTADNFFLDIWDGSNIHTVMYIDSNGLMGLGTNYPKAPIDIVGTGVFRSAKVSFATGVGSYVRIGYDTTNSWGYLAADNSAAGPRDFRIDGKPLELNTGNKSGDVYIAAGGLGKVGVGTTTPNAFLTVKLSNDNQQGVNVSSGSNSNINFQPLTGTNLGFQAINFNGYFNSAEKRYNSSKYRWRLGADQRSTADNFFLDIWNGSTINTAMYIDSSGRVGFGTSSLAANLHIDPKGPGGICLGGASGGGGYTALVMNITSQKGGRAEINSIKSAGSKYGVLTLNTNGGNVGIGDTSASEKLSVSGNICYTGSIGSCSDRRYKTNIITMGSMLTNVMALEPVTYNWRVKEFPDKNFNDKKQLGFIAQDIEKIFPELVLTDQNGYKSVDYVKITPILVKAVQEQQNEIEILKKRLNILEAEQSKKTASVK